MKTIFDFRQYKTYLTELADSPGGRGLRKRLAQAARCQTAYVSQVLRGGAQLSLEQGEAVSRMLGHSAAERDFFLLLIQAARAGTPELRRYFEAKLDEAARARLVVSNRIDVRESLSEQDQFRYYSAWYYAAVHVALTVPGMGTRDRLARRLGISEGRVAEVLEFLVRTGLAEASKGGYRAGKARIHLGADSPMIERHHANWRQQAVLALERERAAGAVSGAEGPPLHYSSAVTLSSADAARIKDRLLAEIAAVKSVVRESEPAEDVHCFCVDFFRV